MSDKIVIVIRGGALQVVYGTNPHTEVELIDYDEAQAISEAAEASARTHEEQARKTLNQIDF